MQNPIVEHAGIEERHLGVTEPFGLELPGAPELRRNRALVEVAVALAEARGRRIFRRPHLDVMPTQVLRKEVLLQDRGEDQPPEELQAPAGWHNPDFTD